jgi:hypothetical protein
MLVAYVYDTYTTYKVDINKNLSMSEDQINYTSKSFDKLQDNIDTDITNIKKKYSDLDDKYTDIDNKYDKKINTYTSNLNHILVINSNLNNIGSNLFNNNITPYTKNDMELNLYTRFSTANDVVIKTASNVNKYFNICDTATNKNTSRCASMSIDNNNFNIYSSNISYNTESNIDALQIYGIANNDANIMAKFDIKNNSIYLGSNMDPAILIVNNTYTPPIITGTYTISGTGSSAGTKLNFTYFTNVNILSTQFVNFYIPGDFTFTTITPSSHSTINNAIYSTTTKILKIQYKSNIVKNTTVSPFNSGAELTIANGANGSGTIIGYLTPT